MKYLEYVVNYTIHGCVVVEATSIENAMEIAGSINESAILKNSSTWGLNISPEDVELDPKN